MPATRSSPYDERCLQALEIALRCVPLYESWRDLDPGEAAGIDERYASLPALIKEGIRAAFPYGLVPRGKDLDAALARGEVSFVRTSGTSDEAVQNIWNQRWWDESERLSWRLNSVAAKVATGAHREAILASALSVGPRSEARPLDRAARTLGRLLFLNEYGRTEDWPDGHERRMLAELVDFQPAVLEANPSLLARLARFAARTGAPVWQPSLIVFTYEFTSMLHLRDIRRVFRSPTASSYGSTEAGYVFMECEHGRLHQNTESCRVDLIPVDGASQGAGCVAKILATTFGNEWFPLLRFEVGDVGRVADGPCPCGRSLGITLSGIEGRLKSLLVADGRLVTHREVDLALGRIDGLEQYRLDQDAPADVRLAVVPERGAATEVPRAAGEVLRGIFGPGVRITVRVERDLHPEASGKFLLAHRAFNLGTRHA